MVSCQDIIPWSHFCLRPLQQFLLPFAKLIEQRVHLHLSLSLAVRSSLSWWAAPNRLTQELSLELPHRQILTTDASLVGWGAHLREDWVEGTWSREETSQSINWLELRAIRLVLQHFQSLSHVLVCTDNTTAKAHINIKVAQDPENLCATLPLGREVSKLNKSRTPGREQTKTL